MTEKLEKKLAVILSFLMVLLTIFASFLIFESRQKKANEALKMQLHQLQLKYSPMQRDTIRDSIKLVTQQVMVMDRGEYKLLSADRKLLEELNLKLRQVVSIILSFTGLPCEADVSGFRNVRPGKDGKECCGTPLSVFYWRC